jgi:bifunctional DNA-binding transcriptional regulator/antitoxin component of YhaV-PrlF toxin-antitoxin module
MSNTTPEEEKGKSGEEKKEEVVKKVDIKKLVSIIPPASELRRKQKVLREKRIRIKYDESLPEGSARVPKDLASMLGIKDGDMIEIVVAGRKKFLFKAEIIEETGTNIVYCYPEELRENGVADNSIATLRKH